MILSGTSEQPIPLCGWFAGLLMLFRYAPLTFDRVEDFVITSFAVLLCLLQICDFMSDENVKLLCDTFYLKGAKPGIRSRDLLIGKQEC